MVTKSVMVVDDDASIRKFIRANLVARDYQVEVASNGIEALNLFQHKIPDLIILDITMPQMDGFEVCRQIRESSSVPLLMLSAKDGESDKVRCLELGADDYLSKPFSLTELLLRMKVMLRRTTKEEATSNQYACHGLTIDLAGQRVYTAGHEVALTCTEYRLLCYLSSNTGRVISPEHILEKVWGPKYIGSPKILWVNICRLRKKLNAAGATEEIIQNKPGLGYLIK